MKKLSILDHKFKGLKNENALFDYLFGRDILGLWFFYLKHYRKHNFHLTCAVKKKEMSFFMFLRHWFWRKIERNKIIILHKFFLIPPFSIDWFWVNTESDEYDEIYSANKWSLNVIWSDFKFPLFLYFFASYFFCMFSCFLNYSVLYGKR